MEVGDKDIYEYIVGLADDRDVVNMLSVNKKFNDDSYFKKILEKRYPVLLRLKEENETYKQFYLRMVKYIAELWEVYKIPYIPSQDFNPNSLLQVGKSRVLNPYSLALTDAVEISDVKLAQYLLDKGANITILAYWAVGKGGNLKTLKFLMEKVYSDGWLRRALASAKEYNNVEIVDYIEKLGIPKGNFW